MCFAFKMNWWRLAISVISLSASCKIGSLDAPELMTVDTASLSTCIQMYCPCSFSVAQMFNAAMTALISSSAMFLCCHFLENLPLKYSLPAIPHSPSLMHLLLLCCPVLGCCVAIVLIPHCILEGIYPPCNILACFQWDWVSTSVFHCSHPVEQPCHEDSAWFDTFPHELKLSQK